jgi:hypothetical protein
VLRAELEKCMRAADLHTSMTDAAVLDELGIAQALVTRKGTRILLEVSQMQRAGDSEYARVGLAETLWQDTSLRAA